MWTLWFSLMPAELPDLETDENEDGKAKEDEN